MIFKINETKREEEKQCILLEQFSILTICQFDPIKKNIRYSVTSFIQYMCLISLCHKTALLVQYWTCLRRKQKENKESYEMLILIKNMTDAHKISLLSSISLSRRLRDSYCMIVHIIDKNKTEHISPIQI